MKPQPRTRRAPDLDQLRAAASATVLKANGPDPAAPRTADTQGQSPATHPAAGNGTVAGNGHAASNQPVRAALAKLTIRMPAGDLGRLRTAWRIVSAQPDSDYPTFGQWVVSVLMDAVEAIEADHNAGKPLPPTPAGVLPTGNAPR